MKVSLLQFKKQSSFYYYFNQSQQFALFYDHDVIESTLNQINVDFHQIRF